MASTLRARRREQLLLLLSEVDCSRGELVAMLTDPASRIECEEDDVLFTVDRLARDGLIRPARGGDFWHLTWTLTELGQADISRAVRRIWETHPFRIPAPPGWREGARCG